MGADLLHSREQPAPTGWVMYPKLLHGEIERQWRQNAMLKKPKALDLKIPAPFRMKIFLEIDQDEPAHLVEKNYFKMEATSPLNFRTNRANRTKPPWILIFLD